MVVTIHDAIARAARVKAFEDFITYGQRHKGVWSARAGALGTRESRLDQGDDSNLSIALDRTAETLGLSVPLPLLGRADEVIE